MAMEGWGVLFLQITGRTQTLSGPENAACKVWQLGLFSGFEVWQLGLFPGFTANLELHGILFVFYLTCKCI